MIKKKPEVFIMYRVKRQIGLTKELQTAVLHVGRRNPAVGVAVLDTGVSSHPDLREQILVFRDFVNEQTGAYDDSGHGTHVAGCVAGNGRLSRGIYSGMHPGCRLVIGKVLNNRGEGRIDHMIKAMEWILHPDCEYFSWNCRVQERGEDEGASAMHGGALEEWDRDCVRCRKFRTGAYDNFTSRSFKGCHYGGLQ